MTDAPTDINAEVPFYQKKVCLLGDFAVGKTSLIRRYVEGRFEEKYLTTVGVVVSRKRLSLRDASMTLLLWDLAGGRDFSQSGYLVGLSGAMLVCDLTRAETLPVCRTYAEQAYQANPEAALILIGNKSDLTDERMITDEQLLALADEVRAPLVITSAKSGERVNEAFTLLAERLITPASAWRSTHIL